MVEVRGRAGQARSSVTGNARMHQEEHSGAVVGMTCAFLRFALLMACMLAVEGTIAGCEAYANVDEGQCLNDAGGQPACCADKNDGSCAAGFNYEEGGNKCGDRYIGNGGGNYVSTCCVPSAAAVATTTTPVPVSISQSAFCSACNSESAILPGISLQCLIT